MENLQNESPAREQQNSIQIQDLFYLCINKWHWFVISLAVCLGVAVWYLLTTPPVYTRTASILIKDDSKGSSTISMEDFSAFGLTPGSNNVSNVIGTLQSPDLMREVVTRLNLALDCKVPGRFHNQTVYGNSLPVNIEITGLGDGESASFVLDIAKNGNFKLSDLTRNGEPSKTDEVSGKFNQTLNTPVGKIKVLPAASYRLGQDITLNVTRSTVSGAIGRYMGGLSVSRGDKESDIINISFRDVSTKRAEDVLNTLIDVYNESWVKDKNQIAVSTSIFIKERLGVIEGELGNVDSDISTYKSENLLPDVKAAAGMYMTQASEAAAGIQTLNNQAYMVKYVRDYLANEGSNQLLPVNLGIGNGVIESQINEYNTKLLERNSLMSKSSDKNPLVEELNEALSAMRGSLLKSLDNQTVALNEQIRALQNTGGQATSRIASNPKQAKYLLSVERQQKVKEALYIYLLQKREENELSQAFTAYNTQVITKPCGSQAPTSPARNNILLIAFAMGLLIPVAIIYVTESMNTVLRGRKDLEGLTIPYVGEIPVAFSSKKCLWWHKKKPVENKIAVVVKEKSRNVINEAFRVVRTNLEFMAGKSEGAHVIMVSSANPGSGKTFITYNLAKSLAIKGKRVLVIDLDLRKGTLSRYVNRPKPGISDFLVGQTDHIADIIYKPVGEDENLLRVIPAGTLPPNPTELLFMERLEQLLKEQRREFDYIFIDCPPVEVVADSSIITKLVDMTVFVVRAGLLQRSMLPEIEKFYTEKKYKNMALILNGTDGGSGRYGYKYGYKYGYNYGYGNYASEK